MTSAGFAVKFYTQEGNWDLVGNNIPVFFIQDAIKFPDVVHSVKQEPDRGFPQAQSAHDNFWDFISLMPEATHMVMWTMSDRAIPRSFRFMEGFGVHSFRFIDAGGRSTFVKFHWKPKQGLQSVVWNEAVKINGADPDFHRRDLWDAIGTGDFPEWELGVQVFDDEFADSFDFDILDATKIIPEELVPVRRVGRLVLDRVVDNFFAETEQVAFCTQNVVPGIDFTNDPLLQGRNFSYLDTQLKRLGGPELHPPPGQRPEVPGRPLPAGRAHGDDQPGRAGQLRAELLDRRPAPGHARTRTGGSTTFPEPVDGPKDRVRSERFADHYSQARQFFVSQTRRRAAAHRRRVRVRAVEVRGPGHPHPDGRQPAQRRRGLRHPHRRRPPARARPAAAPPARAPITDLPPSPALSIVANGPGVLRRSQARRPRHRRHRCPAPRGAAPGGRRRGRGARADRAADRRLRRQRRQLVPAHQKVDGGPSVLYDAVVLLLFGRRCGDAGRRADGEGLRLGRPRPLQVRGLHRRRPAAARGGRRGRELDDGYVLLDGKKGVQRFIKQCRACATGIASGCARGCRCRPADSSRRRSGS